MSTDKAGLRNWLIILFLLCSVAMSAQKTRVSSPYSLYGIGNLTNTNTNVRSMAMGGIKFGLRDPSLINVANPASYTAFDTLSFVFEGALVAGLVTLKSASQSEQSNYATLNYLTFGFPITKWWRSSLGILPYSHVGYDVVQDEIIENVGLVRYLNDGSGGFNTVYWGNGFRITNNFSIGINASYVFGTIDNGLSVTFPDSLYYFSTRKDVSYSASDFVFSYGIQYTIPLKKKLDLTFGAVFSNTSKLRAEKDYLVRNYYGEQNEIKNYLDTVDYDQGIVGDIVLPKSFGFGVVLKKKDQWLVGADVDWQNWKEFKMFGVSDSVQNRLSLSIGAQFIPDKYSIFNYYERLSYRLGFRYINSSLYLKGHQLNQFGISFGVGFPVWKARSTFNFGVEIGKYGTTADGLIQQNFVKFTFGISIHEHWFIKKRYF